MSLVMGGAPPPPLVYDPPPDGPPTILHLDADVLALDKPSGLLSVPGREADRADALSVRAETHHPGARIVHRLDLGASGALLFARNARALRILSGQFAKRLTEKRYVALIAGAPREDEGVVDLPLRADWPNRPRQMIDHAKGKPARSLWRVIARLDGATRVSLTPITGRSHQLRVHMAALGHPILGDPIYGDAGAAARLMLHSEMIGFRHPANGVAMRIEAPCPF